MEPDVGETRLQQDVPEFVRVEGIEGDFFPEDPRPLRRGQPEGGLEPHLPIALPLVPAAEFHRPFHGAEQGEVRGAGFPEPLVVQDLEQEGAPGSQYLREVLEEPDGLLLRYVHEGVPEAHREVRRERGKAQQVRERADLGPGLRVGRQFPPGDPDQGGVRVEPQTGEPRCGEGKELRPRPATAVGHGLQLSSPDQGVEECPLLRRNREEVVVNDAYVRIERHAVSSRYCSRTIRGNSKKSPPWPESGRTTGGLESSETPCGSPAVRSASFASRQPRETGRRRSGDARAEGRRGGSPARGATRGTHPRRRGNPRRV